MRKLLLLSILFITIGLVGAYKCADKIKLSQKAVLFEMNLAGMVGDYDTPKEQQIIEYMEQSREDTEKLYLPFVYFFLVIAAIGAEGIILGIYMGANKKNKESPS